jgi:hypothetical protein
MHCIMTKHSLNTHDFDNLEKEYAKKYAEYAQKYAEYAKKYAEYRLAAPAERWGGFGTCVQR